MAECGHAAILIVTRPVEGTATNVARQRIQLRCSLAAGHPGAHRDSQHDEQWEGEAGTRATLLRHEDENG